MRRDYVDVQMEEPFGEAVGDVDAGLVFAERKAKEWNSNAKLLHIICRYEGKQQIESKKGAILYQYYINIKDIFGDPHVVNYYIGLDLEGQVIRSIRISTDWRISYTDHVLQRDSFSLDELLSVIKKETKIMEEFYKYEKPMVGINFYWHGEDNVNLYSNSPGTEEAVALKYQLGISYPERKIEGLAKYPKD